MDHGRGDAGAVAAVALIDILDHLLAPLMLEIDIDVGRLVAFFRKEAREEQIVLIGSTEVTPSRKQTIELAAEPRPWQRIGGFLRAGEAHEIVDGQKIISVIALADQANSSRIRFPPERSRAATTTRSGASASDIAWG
jgi:hypothetical protein